MFPADTLVLQCILQLLLRQMSTELLCNEWRLRTQDHLVLLLTPQQVCEELLYNERRLRSQDPESPPSPICPGYPGSPGCSVSWFSLSTEPTGGHKGSAYKHLGCFKAPVTLFIDPAGE